MKKYTDKQLDAAVAAVAGNIKARRLALGMTLAEAASAAGLGGPSRWSDLETGRGCPNLRTLYRLADALGADVAALLATTPAKGKRKPAPRKS